MTGYHLRAMPNRQNMKTKIKNPIEERWKRDVMRHTKDLYWHLGSKPRWVTIYKTPHKLNALLYTRPYVATCMPVRIRKYAGEYRVQLYDQKSPVVTGKPYPKFKHEHRTLRKKLEDVLV